MNNQYIPAGSYLLTSSDVTVTINAECQQINGEWVQAEPLSFVQDASGEIEDIANMNGILMIIGSDNPAPNPTDKYGPRVPAGSYQLTSRNIKVTLNGECEQIDGDWVASPALTYTTTQAQGARDIANMDGTLTLG